MVDLTQHKAGIQAAMSQIPQSCSDPRSEFLSVLTAEGFKVSGALTIGKLCRVDGSEDKRGKKSAWYIYNEIEDSHSAGHVIGVGTYGDWKLNITESWCSRSDHQMSAAERQHYTAEREAMRVKRENERIHRQAEAAKKAFELWSNAPACSNDHGYLKKKGVKASAGIKKGDDGRLIIPAAVNNEIVTLQFIDPKGDKRFLSGGRIKGAWYLIEGENDIVYIAEGYSTARSVHEATGKTVYVAFNAGNLYEVTSHAKNSHAQSRIIIAGDDDTGTKGNAGRTKAEQASQGLDVECIFPSGFVDFNDMHKAHGLPALKTYLKPSNQEAYEKKKSKQTKVERPSGILGDMVDYYHATSGNKQEGFAVQTALAVASIILGRSYKTSLNNYSNLHLLNVAKSGTGKEHAKTVVEKILYKAGADHFIAGDGYTSAGAVLSTLLDRPKHISIIDEFGRYLEAGKDMGKGTSIQREANTRLMEAFGRADGIIRAPSYSAMTMKKDAADAIKNRYIHNPSITLLTMTTPETLFKALDMGAIKDGFFNRFIVSLSDTPRGLRHHKEPMEVPDRITTWIKTIMARSPKAHIATEPAEPVVLQFSPEAFQAQLDFQIVMINKANELDAFGMGELPMRGNEMAMKLSLICALSKNPHAEEIELDDIEWAIRYVHGCMKKTISRLKITISSSGFEGDKKEILADLRSRSPDGITWAEMQKNAPYSQHKQRELKEILQALKDANLAGDEPYKPEGAGRPSVKWIALG
jgi:phage/plasmid primase-like uncharacterized protein